MAKSWDNASYTKRAQVLVQTANIDANLAHFPALLVLTDTNAIANADIASKRYQIYDYNGNEMSYDEDTYAEGASYVNAKIWVGGSSTTLYSSPTGDQDKFWLYYGDYDPGSDQDDPTNVWDSSYKAVHHLGEASSHFLDSTANNHDTTYEVVEAYGATGIVGKAPEFVATTDAIAAPSSSDFDWAAQFTIDCWVNLDGNSGYQVFFYRHESSGHSLFLLNSKWGFSPFVFGSSDLIYSNANAATGQWVHLAGVRESDGTTKLYIDGVLQTDTGFKSGAISGTANYVLGNDKDVDVGMDGHLDEARSSSTNRSAAWLKFQHANINEADHEQTWSAEEDKPAGGIVILRRRREAA